MKLKEIILLMVLFMIPVMVNAKICDSKQIKIDSVTLTDKANNVTEIEQPIIEGKNITINLKMMKVNESIEYKMVVKNESNEDYELDEKSLNTNSEYIEYSLKTDDDNLIIKAGKSKAVYLKAQYKNEVPDNAYTNNKIYDNQSFLLNLSNDQTNIIQNPSTGKNLSLLVMIGILVLCLIITTYLMLNKKKNSIFMVILLGIMIAIPINIYALCKNEININFNVTIEKGYEVGYLRTSAAWYTDEELKYYEIGPFTSCTVLYKGEEKYNECSYIIIKENKLYSAGETVNLDTLSFKDFKDKYYDYTIGEWVYLCEEIQEDTYQCPNTLEKEDYTIDTWFYDMVFNEFGYTYDPTDKQVMNFNTYYMEGWDDDDGGYFSVKAPQTFTMPKHNVLFVDRGQG